MAGGFLCPIAFSSEKATYLKQRKAGRIVSVAAMIAVWVNTDGRREVLGMQVCTSEAEVYLTRDLHTSLTATRRCCPVLATEPENRLAAIVNFTFNLGAGRLQTSTLRRRVIQWDWVAAAQELRR